MKYDRLRAGKLLSSFKQAKAQLERLSTLSQEEFLSDPDKIASAKYNFVIAIEAAVDLCQHLIAKNNLRVAEDYADTFRILGEAGVFSEELLPELINMAKFRNRLVHIYWDIDDKMVYEILQHRLSDLDRFLSEISQALR